VEVIIVEAVAGGSANNICRRSRRHMWVWTGGRGRMGRRRRGSGGGGVEGCPSGDLVVTREGLFGSPPVASLSARISEAQWPCFTLNIWTCVYIDYL